MNWSKKAHTEEELLYEMAKLCTSYIGFSRFFCSHAPVCFKLINIINKSWFSTFLKIYSWFCFVLCFISSISECYSQIVGKKYWKISLVVEVITCENIQFITCGLQPLVINSIFSLVITSTTRDIFQYFLSAIWESLMY